MDELRRRLAELPLDRLVVAYCRGPYCAFAHDAVALVREPPRTGGTSARSGDTATVVATPAFERCAARMTSGRRGA